MMAGRTVLSRGNEPDGRPAVGGSNGLAGQPSAYLRQHADNPVDWQPFGDAAFDAARDRDVPVFLSIGYAACHWCHVMAHESFEDEDDRAIPERTLRAGKSGPRGTSRR